MTENKNGAENLEILREEQYSTTESTVIPQQKEPSSPEVVFTLPEGINVVEECMCTDGTTKVSDKALEERVKEILAEKKIEWEEAFMKRKQKDIDILKDRFNFILKNEQLRTSSMLSEAHRERREKISALQTQMECKNLAALMFVLCAERRKCKMEHLKIVEDYTEYIDNLQSLLIEGQSVILNLSRGYKTAARVDHEWREKMTSIIHQFKSFIYNYAGGTPESNQYFFDMKKLMETEAPIEDDPEEYPIDSESDDDGAYTERNPADCLPELLTNEKPWYESLDDECRPFIVLGDLDACPTTERRNVVKKIRAKKTAPKQWAEYVFNEMRMHPDCVTADKLKERYLEAVDPRYDVRSVGSPDSQHNRSRSVAMTKDTRYNSVEVNAGMGTMGSIIKIISGAPQRSLEAKSAILGARDSLEITSTTVLKHRRAENNKDKDSPPPVLDVANRRTSFYDHDTVSQNVIEDEQAKSKSNIEVLQVQPEVPEMDDTLVPLTKTDSIVVQKAHVPETDHKINYEKVCPSEECQRMKKDTFMGSLPPYMRASPFTHFEQTFENYELCSPEQLALLRERVDARKKTKDEELLSFHSVNEWAGIEGVACQTSNLSLLPPCTCTIPPPSSVSSSEGRVVNVADLFPIKQTLDRITKECFFDSQIDFDRFRVIGQGSRSTSKSGESNQTIIEPKEVFTATRLQEIKEILKKHPSLCDLFQANNRG